jgi:hypothetical protein
MFFVAATIYWVIVALWLTVLASVIYFYVRNPGAFGGTRLLLTVIAIDTLRNILENTYFGFYFGGRYGLFPTWVVDLLGMPDSAPVPRRVVRLGQVSVLGPIVPNLVELHPLWCCKVARSTVRIFLASEEAVTPQRLGPQLIREKVETFGANLR